MTHHEEVLTYAHSHLDENAKPKTIRRSKFQRSRTKFYELGSVKKKMFLFACLCECKQHEHTHICVGDFYKVDSEGYAEGEARGSASGHKKNTKARGELFLEEKHKIIGETIANNKIALITTNDIA